VGLVTQTTESPAKFRRTAAAVLERPVQEVRLFNTICEATVGRREAARQLARRVDLMVVLGGRNSANTTALAEICRAEGTRTLHLETAAEAEAEDFAGVARVGVTAGASTPDWVVREFIAFARGIGR
jgi:4-hydroxy-3-methylbut-2-enyl diphosphate reductase